MWSLNWVGLDRHKGRVARQGVLKTFFSRVQLDRRYGVDTACV